MIDREHPADRALRKVTGRPTPSEAEYRRGAERLNAAIASDMRPTRGLLLRAAPAWAVGIAVLVVGIFVTVETLSPSPTEAAIEEIATAAEQIDPLSIPDRQFIYTRSETTGLVIIPAEALGEIDGDREFLVYLLPTVRETWFGNEDTAQISTTNQFPIFFTSQDDNAYHVAGIDQQDAIGETNTITTQAPPSDATWPTDPQALDSAIRQMMAVDRGLPETVEYLDIALDIVREPLTSPELRAMTLRLIGQLPDLKLFETNDRYSSFTVQYEDQGIATRQTITLTSQGHLIAEETRILEPDARFAIPADTTIFRATHTVPLVVVNLDSP